MVGIAVVVIALLVSLPGGGNAEKTAIAAMDAMLKPDMRALLELVPEDVLADEMGTADSENLSDIREDYADYGITLKELSLVEVAVTIAYGEQGQTTALEIPVFKVGGSWYVDMMNMESLF